ncbi:MAG: hypothetical protein ISS93_02640, partial [Candidatus Aenigmarchaeota archaeon]|nr:hypothetical protein [Candidatus Aenigmarchaeota archaeon]
MKIILLGLLAFLVLVSGCIQAPGECQQIGEECCTEDFCVNTSVFMCGTGTFKKVTGCNLTNCVPIISCESESKPIQNQTLPESNETNASQEEQLPEPVEYVPAGPDPEFENFTWTLPTGASTLRLSLPADIDDFLFDDHGGIGGYGLHSGGHIEGLDHTWIELKSGIPVRSWADGYVEDIQSSGDVEGEEYHIRISYGQNLVGNHMEIKTPYVEKYQNVTRGQEIGMGMSFNPLQSSAEMSLVDKGRTDGIVAWGGGVSVSPFDYLMDSDKRKLVDAYKKNVIEPWLKEGKKTWGFEPSEPYLTNKLLIHDDHPGELAGAWYLTSADWEPEYPNDMLTFIEADNPYYKGNVV